MKLPPDHEQPWFPAEWTPEQRQYFIDQRDRENVTRMAKAIEIASGAKRPRIDRIWTRLGFGWANPRQPGEDENDTREYGYFGTTVVVRWTWWERVLILISGASIVRTSCRTDQEVTGMISNSAAAVLPPNFKET